ASSIAAEASAHAMNACIHRARPGSGAMESGTHTRFEAVAQLVISFCQERRAVRPGSLACRFWHKWSCFGIVSYGFSWRGPAGAGVPAAAGRAGLAAARAPGVGAAGPGRADGPDAVHVVVPG